MTPSSSSFSRREFLTVAGAATAGLGLARNNDASESVPNVSNARPGQQHVFSLKFPPLDPVRIGFIGVGNRGSALLGDLLNLEGAQIKAVCDVAPDRAQSAQRRVSGQAPSRAGGLHQRRA